MLVGGAHRNCGPSDRTGLLLTYSYAVLQYLMCYCGHHAGLLRRLVRIVRPGSGSVVTWRAQMVLLSAQGMDAAAIAKVAFTSEDRVRNVIRNFGADGFSSLYPKYSGGGAPKYTLVQRREINKTPSPSPRKMPGWTDLARQVVRQRLGLDSRNAAGG